MQQQSFFVQTALDTLPAAILLAGTGARTGFIRGTGAVGVHWEWRQKRDQSGDFNRSGVNKDDHRTWKLTKLILEKSWLGA